MPKNKDIYGLEEPSDTPAPRKGLNHLFLIAIDNYQDAQLRLENCVSDVQKVVELLCQRYYFEQSNVVFLSNELATASKINSSLKDFRSHDPDDSLIVFFSGHGKYDQATELGYWLPWEADPNDDASWYPVNNLIGHLKPLPHRHILVFIDACFPAAILKDIPYTKSTTRDQSRWAFISGRLDVVSDGAAGMQSPFVQALLDGLKDNQREWLQVRTLADTVKQRTLELTRNQQTPMLGVIPAFSEFGGELAFQLRADFWQETGSLSSLELERYFKVIPVKSVQPGDLMPLRARPSDGFREFYHERPYLDNTLYQGYATRQNLIITGKPLAGKTRSVLQLLKKLKNLELTVLLPKEGPVPKEDFLWPAAPGYLLFIDEIDRFLTEPNSDWLLQKALANDRVYVLATCWKDRYEEVKSSMSSYFHRFSEVCITPLSEEDEQVISPQAAKTYAWHSDGTIGSYFLPLFEMEKRYKSLVAGSLEQEIMRTCKLLFLWHKTTAYATYDKKEIQAYIRLRFQQHYGRIEDFFPAQWEGAFHTLQALALIDDRFDRVAVEEAYLTLFVTADPETLLIEYLRYFPTPLNINNAIRFAPSAESAVRIFEHLKKSGLYLDVFAYTIFVNKAGQAIKYSWVLDEMKAAGIRPDEVTFNSLINKAPNFEEARKVLDEMKTAGIRPDEVTFTSLINKATNFEEARKVLDEMKAAGIRPNEVTFTSLINKATNFEGARKILDEMKAEGIRPDEVTFNSLINKATNFEEARKVLDEMKAEDIRPNKVTFTSLVNKATNFEKARKVLDEMKTEGIRPNEVTFNSLVNKATNFEKARKVLDEMKTEGIRPDEVTFNSLINKATNFEEARKVLDEMKAEGIRPNEVTFNSLINKVTNFEKARKVLDEMKAEGISPNEVTFTSLMKKTADFEQATSIFYEMDHAGVMPSTFVFIILLTKAITLEMVDWVAEWMEEYGVEIDIESFIRPAKYLPTVKSAYKLLFKNGSNYSIDEFAYGAFRNIIQTDLDDAEEFFEALIESKALFNNGFLLDLFVYECLPYLFQESFWDPYLPIVLEQSDEIIIALASQCNIPKYKVTLAESLKKKDWNYTMLIGESYFESDPKEAEQWLKKSLVEVPDQQKPIILELLAKNIVWHQLTDLYPEAQQYCVDALNQQEEGKLHFSLQLLYRMLIDQCEIAELESSIYELLSRYSVPEQDLVDFFKGELINNPGTGHEKSQILGMICQKLTAIE